MSDIRPISEIQRQASLQRQERLKKREVLRRPSVGEDSFTAMNLAMFDSMVEKLMNMDEARPEMVELGKKLAQSKDFPSSKSLGELAEALLSPADETKGV